MCKDKRVVRLVLVKISVCFELLDKLFLELNYRFNMS